VSSSSLAPREGGNPPPTMGGGDQALETTFNGGWCKMASKKIISQRGFVKFSIKYQIYLIHKRIMPSVPLKF